MKFKPCSAKDIAEIILKPPSYQSKCKSMMEEFLQSDADAVEVDCEGQKVENVAANLTTTRRRMSAPVRIVRRKERLFLIKEGVGV